VSTAAAATVRFLDTWKENKGLTVDTFIPIVILHTLAYAWCKILNFEYGAILDGLDYIN